MRSMVSGRHMPVAIALAIAALLPAIACAQIYKCVDASGGTTYQQTPCPANARGGKVELLDNGATRDGGIDEAAWESAAREKNVAVGMPRRFVRLALGTPRDTRAGRTSDNAAEVWSYPEPDSKSLVIGFRNGAVAWLRHDEAAGVAGPVPDDEATQRTLRRRAILEGQDCADIVASLGAPDTNGNAATATDDPATPVVRYTWEPVAGDPYTRTIVICTAGRATSVERVGVR